MIYITYKINKYDTDVEIRNLWEITGEGIEPRKLYNEFMVKQATQQYNLTINPHWLNVMDHQKLNSHLSTEGFKTNSKAWCKFKKSFPVDEYIRTVLNGKQLEFREI